MTRDDHHSQPAEFSRLLDEADGTATAATLGTIVARSRRHREHRLKVVTGVSIVVALAAISVAGIIRGTSGTTSASKPTVIEPAPSSSKASLAGSNWTKQRHALGAAPKGLTWSTSASQSTTPGAGSSSANVATSPGTNFCTVNGCGISYPIGVSGPLSKLFLRTSGDITVRAFQETTRNFVPQSYASSGSAPPGSSSAPSTNLSTPASTTGSSAGVVPIYSSCESSQELVVEVSNPGAVGIVTVPLPSISISEPGQPFEVIDSSAVGVTEASPIEVLTVHVASGVSNLQASFPDGTSDQMAVVRGWAVLVDDGNAPLPATVTAIDSSGNTIATATVNDDGAIAQPEGCLVPVETQPSLGGGTVQPTTSSK